MPRWTAAAVAPTSHGAGAQVWARAAVGAWLVLRIACVYLVLRVLERLWLPVGRWHAAADRWSAAAFVAYARRYGGLLIKVGQFIATRPDLAPRAWLAACGALRDQAPPRPAAEVAQALARAYAPAAPPFADFTPTALAAASFGQVHRATLPSGQVVAVKVQHADLERTVAVDLAVARTGMRLLAWFMPGFPFRDLVQELERSSKAELDYLQEAAAMDRLRPLLAERGVDVPEVLWEHTRATVLVMSFAPGTTLARLDLAQLPLAEREELATRIIDAYLGMLLEQGYYHADPHAGNFVYDRGHLTLLDFGITASLTPRQAELYRQFLGCVERRDIDGMIDLLLRLGFMLPHFDRDHLRELAQALYESVVEVAPQSLAGSRRGWEIGWAINEVLLQSRGLIFPHHTILLSRAVGMLEGLCAELVPERSMLTLARPVLRRRLTYGMHLRHLLAEIRELKTAIAGIPERLAALKRGPDYTVHAVLAGCVLLGAFHLPHGVWRDAAVAVGAVGAVHALRRHRA